VSKRVTKSPGAFRTISEVADELDLRQHVLRFWETRFPQIKPVKRGGGRRYYRAEDVELLKAIRHLLYDQKITIKGVQKILREQGAKALMQGAGGGDANGLYDVPLRPRSDAGLGAEAAIQAIIVELAAIRRLLQPQAA
jgi:DNA-binding transcriptional MerR regulator